MKYIRQQIFLTSYSLLSGEKMKLILLGRSINFLDNCAVIRQGFLNGKIRDRPDYNLQLLVELSMKLTIVYSFFMAFKCTFVVIRLLF